ncbi:MAG: hypothetical protein HKN08_12010 [Gammaproteobacteria bacterium]|nr:hypothetical protein [Gammaproteobacteria bacterium]
MNLSAWWQERIPRERMMLLVAVVVVVILATYLAMEPIMQERDRMKQSLPQLRTDLQWMKKNSARLKSLQAVQGDSDSSTPETISLSVVQSMINNLALQEYLDELGPGTGQSVRVQFGNIPFTELMTFLYGVKANTSANISSAQIYRVEDDQQGMVQAALILGG